ncbi:LuxR family transcriptional regulator [Salmonella enterica subsp. enterica serovar Minnesota]|nr:LuxR family transcriptional regulator [Salmonella enterica subsp. enterica serovar Minnesota]EAR0069267.1 LuxR family transcriptional regulator [Salmonella enterica subsp. enterica serovar Minnesota]EAR0394212.1 LuxR family transcriptional regulator [Salmonella enterica subsp. enterica serovar Minnesota]
MMHIFTTTRNTWLMQGLREALQEDGTDVRVHSVESAGELFCAAGSRLPPDSVLLPVFPDNHLADCLRSLTFLSEWTRTGHPEVPCLLWGGKTLICGTEGESGTVIPWRLPPARLRGMINHGVQAWRDRVNRGDTVCYRMRLSPREVTVLRYTLEGATLEQMAGMLGVKPKTVWTQRRQAMNALGIRRLYDLMHLPREVFCETTV